MSEPVPVTETPTAAPDFATFEAAENKLSAAGEWPAPAATTSTETDTPAAATTTTAAEQTDKGYTPPKPGSKRTERRAERDQDQINETIRKAVTEATEATERRLRAEFEAKKPAAEPTPTPAAAAPVVDPSDPKPVSDTFDNYDDFIDARADWRIRQAKREADAATERASADQRKADEARTFEETMNSWETRRDGFISKRPDRVEPLNDFLAGIRSGTALGDGLMDSSIDGPQVADYLASHPDEAERIARLSPVSALLALGKIDTLFSPTTSPTTSASATSAGPAAKIVTTAPAPPTTLAARSADPADPVAAAVARGDYSAFEAEENRRAVAR